MPQIKPEYELVKEFADIASALVERHPSMFGGIDIGRVRCFAIMNKKRKDDKVLWEIKAVGMPMLIDCPFAWYYTIYMGDWAEMSDKHRQHLVADMLFAIPKDGEEGKINRFDMKDFSVMLRSFGTDYLQNSPDELTDLLSGDVKWVYTVDGDNDSDDEDGD